MNNQTIDVNKCFERVKKGTVLIDVRSPVEFKKGALPGAVNIPLLTDDQRHQIGICYKTKGQDEAIALGHELVCGVEKKNLIKKWIDCVHENPNAIIYCFRGGLRSHIAQAWLRESGYSIPLVSGGYKAGRHFLLGALERLSNYFQFFLISGQTGCCKTQYLHELKSNGYAVIDLEGLAQHCGSAFGSLLKKQPTQVNFEHQLAWEMMRYEYQSSFLLIESEGSYIGSIQIPQVFYRAMCSAPIFNLESSIDDRVRATYQYYVDDFYQMLKDKHGYDAWDQMKKYYFFCADRIKKRLGGACYQQLISMLEKSFDYDRCIDITRHDEWIRYLLEHYYDPMYAYLEENNKRRMVCSGSFIYVRECLDQHLSFMG